MLKVVIMTQQDRFFLPKNIQKVIDNADVRLIVNVDYKSSLENKVSDFIKWFGFFQVAKLGLLTISRTILGKIDQMFGYKLLKGLYGIENVAKKNKIPYMVIHDSNSKEFFEVIKKINPDVIVSFSAPQVIKEPLLSFPKYGIINVHGSYLPDYRGCLPSFWQLYNEEEYAGATVHLMSDKIDDGEILAQEKVYIKDCRTMFEVIKRTKQIGGELVIKVLKDIEKGTVQRKPNIASQGRYFSWPKIENGKIFRKKRKKLI